MPWYRHLPDTISPNLTMVCHIDKRRITPGLLFLTGRESVKPETFLYPQPRAYDECLRQAHGSAARKPPRKQRVFGIAFRNVPADFLPEWHHVEMIAQVPADER